MADQDQTIARKPGGLICRTNSLGLHDSPGSLAAKADNLRIRPELLQNDTPLEVDSNLPLLNGYLLAQGNTAAEIARLHYVLKKPTVILEIGCGSGEVAWQIAQKNPNIGVIATDQFNCPVPADASFGYQQVAEAWQNGCLPVQQTTPDNLLVLRAECELLQFLPCRAIDTLLLINAEPIVGRNFVNFIQGEAFCRKLRPGHRQIVILPYCREMGVMACGGYEFDHAEDWSRGLGYILGSRLAFKKGARMQWGVDLRRVSPYSGNSTQSDIFVYGECF
jgi:hypothetical protein